MKTESWLDKEGEKARRTAWLSTTDSARSVARCGMRLRVLSDVSPPRPTEEAAMDLVVQSPDELIALVPNRPRLQPRGVVRARLAPVPVLAVLPVLPVIRAELRVAERRSPHASAREPKVMKRARPGGFPGE